MKGLFDVKAMMARISRSVKCVSRLTALPHRSCFSTARHNRTTFLFGPSCRSYSDSQCEKDTFLSRLLQSWTQTLSQAGVPEASPSVDLIVAHALDKKMIHEVDMNAQPPEHVIKRIDEMCQERLKRIPVQYILGEWDFHDMTLEMRQPVLIPRPETEELADMVVKKWRGEHQQDGSFIEMGCGSGALSLYILRELTNVKCVTVDKNEIACNLTLRNAARYNLEDRLHVIQGDIFDGSVISKVSSFGPFDVVVSNPPYLTSEEMNCIEAEVADYEDHGALHGGTDGLDIVRHILAISHTLLRTNQSVLWLEVGLEQPDKIRRIVESHPEYRLSYEETLRDYTQRDRFCKLQLKR